MHSIDTPYLEIRPLIESDLPEVVNIEHASWHEYYCQYPIYQIIKGSVTEAILLDDWKKFLAQGSPQQTSLVVGHTRHAYVAILNGEVVGVGAVSSYVENKWTAVDELLRQPDGRIKKTAKFQELYIKPEVRRHGIGRHLSIIRADYMLQHDYEALFLTTYADAEKTNEYHLKNGLTKVHEYLSMQVYENGERVKIACFLDLDLKNYRDRLEQVLKYNIETGQTIPVSQINY